MKLTFAWVLWKFQLKWNSLYEIHGVKRQPIHDCATAQFPLEVPSLCLVFVILVHVRIVGIVLCTTHHAPHSCHQSQNITKLLKSIPRTLPTLKLYVWHLFWLEPHHTRGHNSLTTERKISPLYLLQIIHCNVSYLLYKSNIATLGHGSHSNNSDTVKREDCTNANNLWQIR